VLTARRAERHALANRYRQISQVLARFGLGFLVGSRLGTATARPERLRLALEELGPTFIKLGQILSTRVDLLPAEYIDELTKLQDAAPALPAETVRAILSEELGPAAEAKFASFDDAPLAAASIGQTHAATLRDGTAVVVKVRRPGVVERIDQDIAVLADLATVAVRRWPIAQDYDVAELVEEYAEGLRSETDYLREARNAQRFAADFRGDSTVHIPRVFTELSTVRVLTMERLSGRKLVELSRSDAGEIDRHQLATRLTQMVLAMIFRHGFFHADPHPGNFFVEPDGRIGVVDFGLVGSLDARARDRLAWALIAFASADPDRQVDALIDLGVVRRRIDRASLRRDMERLFTRYYGSSVGDIAVAAMIEDLVSVMRRHHLQLPSNFALLLKTIVMHEGLAVQLDPGFNLATVMTPYARQLIRYQLSPARRARRLGEAGLDAMRLSEQFAQQAGRILGTVERGDLEMVMRPAGFESVTQPVQRALKLVSLTVLSMTVVLTFAILLATFHAVSDRWVAPLIGAGLAVGLLWSVYLGWRVARRP
jgi:ubiquinone biosynthesis protein